MTVSIVYHTRFGNNAAVAQLLSDHLESLGHGVSIHPISEARPSEIPASELYLLGSPTQIGTLPMRMGRFLKKIKVPEGARYAVFATYAEPGSGAAGRMATEMEDHGAEAVVEALVLSVKDLKGPLEDNWNTKVETWASQVSDGVSKTV